MIYPELVAIGILLAIGHFAFGLWGYRIWYLVDRWRE